MHPTPPQAWTSASNNAPTPLQPHLHDASTGQSTAGADPGEPAPDALLPVGSAAAASQGPGVSRNANETRWQLRPDASHLVRAANGVYYLRLVVPERVRAIHPGLPRELRRSTKTTLKGPALRKAREMCAELATSLTPIASDTLVPSPTSPLASLPAALAAGQQGFRLEYVNGRVHTEIFPGANAETLGLMARVLPLFAQHPAQPEPAPAPTPAANAAAFAPFPPGAAGTSNDSRHAVCAEPDATALPRTVAIDGEHAPNVGRTGLGTAPSRKSTTDDSACSTPEHAAGAEKLVWLLDAIQDWRKNGATRFSAQTWQFAYAPSFRVLRELLGTERRDIVQPDNTITPNVLDIRLSDLRREHIERLRDQLKLMPQRQGKRQDGVEAGVLIAQAKAKKLPLQSPRNVAKKLRHVFPFFQHADAKEWVDAGVLKELKLVLKAAESRANQVSQGVHKLGAVALMVEELCRTYESDAYVNGAIEFDWKFWCDPLRLFMGARVAEIAQLFTNDIVEVEGVPCISFVNDLPKASDADADSGEFTGELSKAKTFEEYRRLKNKASRRIIPIHPQLIEMGFLDWVRLRQEIVGRNPGLLFYGLLWAPKSGYGRKPAEHTLKLLKEAEVWQSRRKVGHSLRSCCAQELQRVGMPGELIDRFLGHSLGTQREQAYSETYQGPAYPARIGLEYLQKTDFGVRFPSWSEISALREAHRKEMHRRRSDAQFGARPRASGAA